MRTITGVILVSLLFSCSAGETTGEELRQWRRGVWQLTDGSYAIYTDSHYFVVSASGDSAQASLHSGWTWLSSSRANAISTKA